MSDEIELYDGKYKFIREEDGTLTCVRYGEDWRDFIGDNAVCNLFDYAIDLRTQLAERDKKIEQLTLWKQEQLDVENSWDVQEVSKEMGLKLGSDIRRNILPFIKKLKERLEKAENKDHKTIEIKDEK